MEGTITIEKSKLRKRESKAATKEKDKDSADTPTLKSKPDIASTVKKRKRAGKQVKIM